MTKKAPNLLPDPEPPYELLNLTQKSVKTTAAGLTAIIHAIKNLVKEKTLIRGGMALLKMNQFDGFDCSSCAWPDPDDERSPIGEFCENGVKALADEATTLKIGPDFFKQHSVYDLSQLSDYALGHFGRISDPMYLPQGATHYEPISWDLAFQKIASHLNALSSPDEAAFYTSGRLSNEASFVYQLFVRAYGTNNFPDCANMCHETSGFALNSVLGVGKGTVKLEDFYNAEIILIAGQNPGTNAPRMLPALEKGKANGAKIIAINPLPEAGLMGFQDPKTIGGILGKSTDLADIYVPVKIHGDMAFFKALIKILYTYEEQNPNSVFDQAYIASKTTGYQELIEDIKRYDLHHLADEAGIPLENIYEVAELIKFKKRIIAVWGMGLTQQPNGVDMVKEILNLLLLKGSIGIPGGGACPVRGHSNVQGNRTMLINNEPTQSQLDSIHKVFGFDPPRHHGYDVVNAIKAIHQGKLKVFFAMGGNFLSATPDTTYTAQALRKLDLTVSVSTKLNRTHLIHGKESLILPTLSRSDIDEIKGIRQYVSTENSMGVVESSQGILKPVSQNLMSEMQIACRVAMATLGTQSKIDWQRYHDSYHAIRDDIEKTIPGFENYNQRVIQKGGFYLPNAARNGEFKTETFGNKAPLTITQLPDNSLLPGEYLMATTRTHDQFNTTIYGLDDRYRGIYNERRVIMMNADDIQNEGLKPYDLVDIYNFDQDTPRIAPLFKIVPYPIPRRNAMTYFPEANVLISIHNTVKGSNMPASKHVKIQIKPHNPDIYSQLPKQ